MNEWLFFLLAFAGWYALWWFVMAVVFAEAGNYGQMPPKWDRKVGGVGFTWDMWVSLVEVFVDDMHRKGLRSEEEIRREFERSLSVVAGRKVRLREKEWRKLWEMELKHFFN